MASVKGSALDARILWVKTQKGEESLKALLSRLSPEDREICGGVILPSHWYPFATFVHVNEVIDATFGKGDLALVPEIARFAAGHNLPTLYRFFYSVSSVGFILSMASRLWRMNYDAGELRVVQGTNSATIFIEDWPEPHRAHCLSVLGWAARSAELSGGKDVVAEMPHCRASGDADCELVLRWN
ncbi:MAG TPA: hypothetical protein VMV18_06130 [bacterium]|nr:hypothetical protein [bacterium]